MVVWLEGRYVSGLERKSSTDHGNPDAPEIARLDVHSMPGHYIRRLQQVATRLFAEDVTGAITPVQFAALLALRDRPGIGQAALSELIGYDRATIGGVIDRLEAKQWVRRSPSPTDRRSNSLTLTDKGKTALDQARPQVEQVQKKLLAPLNARERQIYAAMCEKILKANKG